MGKQKTFIIYLYSSLIAVLVLLFLFFFIFIFILNDNKKEISSQLKKETFLLSHEMPFFFDTETFLITANIFFPNNLFEDRYKKAVWLEKLNAFFEGYKDNFSKIVLQYYKSTYNVIFYEKNGNSFYFANGKILPALELFNKKKYNKFIHHYPKGIIPIKKAILFPKPINYSFLSDIYGNSKDEIWSNLKPITVFGKRVFFNRKNHAYLSLKKAINEINKESKIDRAVLRWIQMLKNISSYSPRSISNDERRSLHSYAIAIDFIPYGHKAIYWNWSDKFVSEWWNIPEKDRIKIPEKVINIFEKNGFIWGGKWFFFDYMHFEYRPEILYYKLNAF